MKAVPNTERVFRGMELQCIHARIYKRLPRLHSLKQEDGNHEGMKEFEYGGRFGQEARFLYKNVARLEERGTPAEQNYSLCVRRHNYRCCSLLIYGYLDVNYSSIRNL
ncbi:hypothetical protein [Candidatus Villigracilis saccharophilus]|uniref:hypothetical protein n=1 Tax=Candidatus Villigracilis saccharophilus TaxID=3140684 RepID=UPI00313751B6|nr:hypothetical protein [Anaerolineales bacterium]